MKLLAALVFACSLSGSFCFSQADFQNGDIVFIKNKETKGKSLLPNGKSKYNYVGIIFIENDVPIVYHSKEPLSKCTFDEFMKLAEGKEYDIKQLAEKDLMTADAVHTMHNFAMAKVGTSFDNSLKLNNELMYNAEFIWKIYQAGTGVPLCIPREIREYKVDNPAAIEFLTEAYGEAIMNEKIVTVGDLYQSQFLE